MSCEYQMGEWVTFEVPGAAMAMEIPQTAAEIVATTACRIGFLFLLLFLVLLFFASVCVMAFSRRLSLFLFGFALLFAPSVGVSGKPNFARKRTFTAPANKRNAFFGNF